MGKKYYCDYCDTSFPDSLEGRKKHNSGLIHQQMKDAHYNQFTDFRTKLNQELAKGPCQRYLRGMLCRFGENCKFSHLNQYEIDVLRNSAQWEETQNFKLPIQLRGNEEPSIPEFLSKIEDLLEEKKISSSNRICDSDELPTPAT